MFMFPGNATFYDLSQVFQFASMICIESDMLSGSFLNAAHSIYEAPANRLQFPKINRAGGR